APCPRDGPSSQSPSVACAPGCAPWPPAARRRPGPSTRPTAAPVAGGRTCRQGQRCALASRVFSFLPPCSFLFIRTPLIASWRGVAGPTVWRRRAWPVSWVARPSAAARAARGHVPPRTGAPSGARGLRLAAGPAAVRPARQACAWGSALLPGIGRGKQVRGLLDHHVDHEPGQQECPALEREAVELVEHLSHEEREDEPWQPGHQVTRLPQPTKEFEHVHPLLATRAQR